MPHLQVKLVLVDPLTTSTKNVGVRVIRNPKTGSALRVFYPSSSSFSSSSSSSSKHPKTSIHRPGYAYFMTGYFVLFSSFMKFLPRPILQFLSKLLGLAASIFLPQAYFTLPSCRDNLPPPAEKLPLLVWSHGLTGTGDEHGYMASILAQNGYIVAMPHHSDGSSSRCDISSTTSNTTSSTSSSSSSDVWYQQPDYTNYDPLFRQKQAEHRAAEVADSIDIILADSSLGRFVDVTKLAVGGFSFGAATAGCVLAGGIKNMKHDIKAAVLGERAKYCERALRKTRHFLRCIWGLVGLWRGGDPPTLPPFRCARFTERTTEMN